MKNSTAEGMKGAKMKRTKTELKLRYIGNVLELPLDNPENLQRIFIFILMLLTWIRGGQELRNLHFGMFKKVSEKDGYYYRFDPNSQKEKNHSGGLTDFRKKRETVNIEFLEAEVSVAKNPGRVFNIYF